MADAGRAPDFSDLNPAFSSRLDQLKAELDRQGIKYSMLSGYRSPEYQGQMRANHDAVKAHQPIPYPNVESPSVVAPAWRSFHNYGLATDFGVDNPADFARIRALAPRFGLSGIGATDPGHIQLAGTLDQDIKQYRLAGWRPSGQPAPTDAVAYAPPPPGQPPQNLLNRGTTMTSNPFYSALTQIESGGRNIPSEVDKDYAGQPGSKSQGYAQIDTPTWLQFARAAGVDTVRYPNAMSAPPEVQQQVAYHIPIGRFGGQTLVKLAQQFGPLDKNLTVGDYAQKYGGANAKGTTLTSTPALAESGIGSGIPTPAQPNAAAVAAETPPAPPQSFADRLFKKPPSTVDEKGNVVEGKSGVEKLADSISPPKAQQAPAAPPEQQAAPVQDPMQGMAPAAQQLFQTVQQAAAKPLMWNSRPYGSMAGQQFDIPGMTLNSMGGQYG